MPNVPKSPTVSVVWAFVPHGPALASVVADVSLPLPLDEHAVATSADTASTAALLAAFLIRCCMEPPGCGTVRNGRLSCCAAVRALSRLAPDFVRTSANVKRWRRVGRAETESLCTRPADELGR